MATFSRVLPCFDHVRRYLPALMQLAGWKTLSVPVSHLPREPGQPKYIKLGRALVGIRDLMDVAWQVEHSHVTAIRELSAGPQL